MYTDAIIHVLCFIDGVNFGVGVASPNGEESTSLFRIGTDLVRFFVEIYKISFEKMNKDAIIYLVFVSYIAVSHCAASPMKMKVLNFRLSREVPGSFYKKAY